VSKKHGYQMGKITRRRTVTVTGGSGQKKKGSLFKLVRNELTSLVKS